MLVLGVVGLVGAGLLADWWTKQGKPPPTSLRCANCPRLTRRIRQLQLLSAGLGICLVGALFWGVTKGG